MENNIIFLVSSDKIHQQVGENMEKLKPLNEFINKKGFRVVDTDLTYRKINHLSKNLLKDEDRKEGSWRLFTFKELVFIRIVEELRKYGFVDDQLINLRDAFFDNKHKKSLDFTLIEVFGKIKIILIVDHSGFVGFYNESTFDCFVKDIKKSFISINFNQFVMDVWEGIGKEKFGYNISDDIFLANKEEELISLIRNNDYDIVNIKKNDSSIIVKAGGEKVLSNDDLVKIIKTKSFGNIEIVKRDGKVVNVKVEDVFKLS